MVKFIFAEETSAELIYWYYPEGNFDFEHGIIVCNKDTGSISIKRIAEGDYEREIPPEEMNELIVAINQMKEELGETDFLDMETEPEHSVFYGDHAVERIRESFLKGEILKEGTVAWY